MTRQERLKLQRMLDHLIGLELWLTGELELNEQELLHHFSSLQARMAVVQAIAWPSDADLAAEDDAASDEADSSERNQYG